MAWQTTEPVPVKPTSSSSGNKSCNSVGFINKEYTCSASSKLQAWSTVSFLCSRLPSESSITRPISKATILNMSIRKGATKAIDPSNFLWVLKLNVSNIWNVPFDFNSPAGCCWSIACCFGRSYREINLSEWPCLKHTKDSKNLQHLSLFSSKKGKLFHLTSSYI